MLIQENHMRCSQMLETQIFSSSQLMLHYCSPFQLARTTISLLHQPGLYTFRKVDDELDNVGLSHPGPNTLTWTFPRASQQSYAYWHLDL